MTAIIKSGADVQSLLKPTFLNSVSSQVRTDLTFSDLTQMAKSYRAGGDQLETDYTHGTGFLLPAHQSGRAAKNQRPGPPGCWPKKSSAG
ncbi:hypothetical protein ACXO54_01960 [Lactobacillus delbrueckii subsp. bulgaricus]